MINIKIKRQLAFFCYNKSMKDILYKLSKSKFRSSFHLNQKMKEYVKEKGFDLIESHAYDIINKRIKPKYIPNDGKQTPMKNHPVLLHSMQLLLVVDLVLKNGIKYLKIGN